MYVTGNLKYRPTANLVAAALATAMVLAGFGMGMTPVSAQVRSKRPDRGTYVPPRLQSVTVERLDESRRERTTVRPTQRESVQIIRPEPSIRTLPSTIRQTTAQEVSVHEAFIEPPIWTESALTHDTTCDGCASCCDDGCDSLGYCPPWRQPWSNARIGLDPCRWFGSVELLLMWRRGETLPILVTTGPDTDPDTAGEIGQTGTETLAGGQTVLKDIRAGGRFTLGTWLDDELCRSLVLRGWFAGKQTYDFGTQQNQTPVFARPFLNVSDNQAAAQDAQLIAFPSRADGSINVSATSNVAGADVSVRQLWFSEFGGSVDVLYGYQFMRLDESLRISSTSISLDADFAPLGSVISVSDLFDVENEFHGGQFGVASRYREGCWSFHSLAKTGFGALQRRKRLTGSTTTSIADSTAVDPNGLLVRSTNAGTTTDSTFGWVPELDFSLGWHRYPRFDLTFGYHVIAMTEALQPAGAVDPDLAVNLSDPPIGQQRPEPAGRYRTFYVQGIHFGLQSVY